YVQNPYTQNPYTQSPFAQSQFGQNSFAQGALGQSPFVPLAINAVQQIVPVLGQIAQQIAVQSAMTQQIGTAVHQLAHQLAVHGMQTQQGLGSQVGQPYGGFNPQAQPWGAQRSQQTIQ